MMLSRRIQMAAAGAGVTIINPADLNPVIWLDAADMSTLAAYSSGSPPLSGTDGEGVGRWTSKTASTSFFYAPLSSYEPKWYANQQNGLPGIVATDTNDFLEVNGNNKVLFRNKSYGYVFVVFKPNNTSASRAVIFGADTSTSGNARIWLEEGNTAQRYRMLTRRGTSETSTDLQDTTDHGGATKVITGVAEWADNVTALRVNGTEVDNGTYSAGAGTTEDANAYGISIFSDMSKTRPSPGMMHELLIYTPATAFTAAQIAGVEAYLMDRWGITS